MDAVFDSEVPFFKFATIPDFERQQHAVLTRQGGVSERPYASLNLSVSVPDDPAHVAHNRRQGYAVLGKSVEEIVLAHLVHGADVGHVTTADQGDICGQVDGLITAQPGCTLAMNFADCAPILLYDPFLPAIGLGHAGWQGAVKDLPGAMVRAMREQFGSDPATLWAGVGPCIGPCCYEVGEPVISAVEFSFPEPTPLLHATAGPRPHFDLPAANRQRLQNAGVKNVEMSDLCTACRTDLFFSHRAEKGRTGRFGVIFTLVA